MLYKKKRKSNLEEYGTKKKGSSEMLKESWYKWTELLLKDTRVKKHLDRERKMAEKKYLQLPFIQHFSLTDGNIYLPKILFILNV